MQKCKVLFMLVIISGLASCANFSEKKRIIASETVNGNETGNRENVEVIEGIVKQVECNRPTGLGAIELHTKKDKIIEVTWYKVNSPDLCSKLTPSQYIRGGAATRLTELSAENLLSASPTISSIKIVDGFVIDVTSVRKVDFSSYTKGVTGYEIDDSVRETFDWYFQNRKGY